MNKKARFRKGQLVAVRHEYFGALYNDDGWWLGIYLRKLNTTYSVRLLPPEDNENPAAHYWRECVPAQEIWPWLKDLNPRVIDDAT